MKEQYKKYNSRLPSRPSSPLSSCSYDCPIASLLGANTAPIINEIEQRRKNLDGFFEEE